MKNLFRINGVVQRLLTNDSPYRVDLVLSHEIKDPDCVIMTMPAGEDVRVVAWLWDDTKGWAYEGLATCNMFDAEVDFQNLIDAASQAYQEADEYALAADLAAA